MSTAVQNLLQTALSLSADEQREFHRAFQEAMDNQGVLPFDDTWLEEIQRRSAAYDRGLVTPIPWSEVQRQATR